MGVDDRVGDLLRQIPDDFDILPGGMENLGDLLVRHQVEKRRKVDAVSQGVNDDGLVG